MKKPAKASGQIERRPEEIVYRGVYAPLDLHAMLASAGTRSRIRRLPAPQLYFGLLELDDDDVAQLLPHVTEEQWRGVLDLSLWSRDRVKRGEFLRLQRHLLTAEDAVARKLLRAVDKALWELTFKRDVRALARVEEDYEGEPPRDREWMATPDGNYLLVLPKNPEKARLLRSLIHRLFELDPEAAAAMIEESRQRTVIEIEEDAYQARRRRIEDLGFQDYFDALSVYAYLEPEARLPEKTAPGIERPALAPAHVGTVPKGSLLLFEALSRIDDSRQAQGLLEELFFVCNKVLSADRGAPASSDRMRRGIRKAICCLNLGLDCWSGGSLSKAVAGVRRHYLQSFFQYGYSRLADLQKRAAPLAAVGEAAADAVLQGMRRPFPMLAVRAKKGYKMRFFRRARDLERVRKVLQSPQRTKT